MIHSISFIILTVLAIHSNMAPKLYYSELSAPARSVLVTAAAIGLELEKQEVDLSKGEHLTPEFLKVNILL